MTLMRGRSYHEEGALGGVLFLPMLIHLIKKRKVTAFAAAPPVSHSRITWVKASTEKSETVVFHNRERLDVKIKALTHSLFNFTNVKALLYKSNQSIKKKDAPTY